MLLSTFNSLIYWHIRVVVVLGACRHLRSKSHRIIFNYILSSLLVLFSLQQHLQKTILLCVFVIQLLWLKVSSKTCSFSFECFNEKDGLINFCLSVLHLVFQKKKNHHLVVSYSMFQINYIISNNDKFTNFDISRCLIVYS